MYLTVSCTPSDIEVIVEDDGQGFDTSSSHNILTAGLGLQTIKERCNKLQGECEIESTLNKGTIIHINLSLFTKVHYQYKKNTPINNDSIITIYRG